MIFRATTAQQVPGAGRLSVCRSFMLVREGLYSSNKLGICIYVAMVSEQENQTNIGRLGTKFNLQLFKVSYLVVPQLPA